jgi:hypothetical protein
MTTPSWPVSLWTPGLVPASVGATAKVLFFPWSTWSTAHSVLQLGPRVNGRARLSDARRVRGLFASACRECDPARTLAKRRAAV